MKIAADLHYVGVNDRTKHLFENMWPLPYGVSYNSYIIEDDKIALIDTVEADFFDRFLANIKNAIGEKPIDYLIVNHVEPDHSGSINLIKKYYPNITIVGNKKVIEFIEGYYGPVDNPLIVAEGATLELGHHSLTFSLIPLVHWPECMVTLDTTTATLFSADAFGCYGALNGAVLDTDMNLDHYWSEMERYYANIVGKYGMPVQKALAKLAGAELKMICSTHGPVWTENIAKVVSIYDRLSKYATEKGLVICYGSMYSNTEQMAEAVAQGAAEAGLKNIIIHNVSVTHPSYIIADVFRYQALAVGSPTYNNAIFPEVESLLSKLQNRDIKNHYISLFGGFTWAPAAVKKMGELVTAMKWELIGEPVENKQGVKPQALEQCRELGKQIATKLLEN